MDKGTQTELHIRRLPEGGYVVRDGFHNPGHYNSDFFASESIEAALAFIRDMMLPIQAKSE